jgi:hypothetical protein
MAVAFYVAAIQNPESMVCHRIGRAIDRNKGVVNERGVDAHVSFRTSQKLKKEGVL